MVLLVLEFENWQRKRKDGGMRLRENILANAKETSKRDRCSERNNYYDHAQWLQLVRISISALRYSKLHS